MARRRGSLNTAGLAMFQMQRVHGWRKTIWLMEFMASWAIAVRHNDWQPIDAEHYARYWGLSRAKGYRDQQMWRDLFPDEPTPNERVIAARSEYEALVAEQAKEPTKHELAVLLGTLPAAG